MKAFVGLTVWALAIKGRAMAPAAASPTAVRNSDRLVMVVMRRLDGSEFVVSLSIDPSLFRCPASPL
jgi:hypothetical protein